MAVTSASSAKTIEERLQALEDEKAILHNLNQYARTLDYGAPVETWLDCFVEDGVWFTTVDKPFAGTTGIRLEGHKELAEWFMKSGRHVPGFTKDTQTKHLFAAPEIVVSGDTATCSTYMITPTSGPEGPHLNTMGRYEDKLVRCADGRWRFVERHLHREGAAPALQNVSAGGHEAPGETPQFKTT